VTDQPYPAEALTAAISAYNKSYLTSNRSNPRFVEKVVTAVLEAAAPLIAAQAAAAERERIRQYLLGVVTSHASQGNEHVLDALLVAVRELGGGS
jgi:hypothetical protein